MTKKFIDAPDAVLEPAPKDGVVPEKYHAMSIFPEYFKIEGKWILAEESRMDCVAVYENGIIAVKEFRNVRKGDLIVIGRTENGEDGIYVHPDGFGERKNENDIFAFRQGRGKQPFQRTMMSYTSCSDTIEKRKIVWVMGPAFTFDFDARDAFSRLIQNGYVHAVMAGNALATHDLEAAQTQPSDRIYILRRASPLDTITIWIQ